MGGFYKIKDGYTPEDINKFCQINGFDFFWVRGNRKYFYFFDNTSGGTSHIDGYFPSEELLNVIEFQPGEYTLDEILAIHVSYILNHS